MTKTQANRNGETRKKFSRSFKLAILIRDEFLCQCCGRDLRKLDSYNVTLDHLRAWVENGSDEAHNLVSCCRSCNSARRDVKWTAFYPAGAQVRVRATVRRKVNINLAKAIIRGNVKIF
jgi:5-methylcytosine-specific restriction endonuclease McrA